MTINQAPIQYKGDDLAPERGPGLGCFRFQLIVLGLFIVLTPLSVAWNWPAWISAGLLFAVIALLLFAGQTIIFLLRLVAADRRSRRRPMASRSKTVGELEDDLRPNAAAPEEAGRHSATVLEPPGELDRGSSAVAPLDDAPSSDEGPVR